MSNFDDVPRPPRTPGPPPPGAAPAPPGRPQHPTPPSWAPAGTGPPAPGQPAPPPAPIRAPDRSRRPWLIALGALVAVVGLLGALAVRDGDDDDPSESASPTTAAATTPATTAAAPDATVAPSTSAAPAVVPPATSAPTTAPAAVDTPTPSELARSIVQVQLLLDGEVVCTGSGTILEPDGTILTNSHVIAQNEVCPHDTIGIAVLDVPELPPQLLFEADVLVDDPDLDLAVIRIARTLDGGPVQPDFPTVALGDSDAVELGDELDVIGYPGIGGDTITFTVGTVSGFVTVPGLGDRSWLKTDATLAGGNSGGMASNSAGEIVGIPTIVGTGDGRITDCRAVQDTNGDGRVDQDDACVPVGGFINGIRPVNIALDLLARAATATPMTPTTPMVDVPQDVAEFPSASNPRWSLDVDGAQPVVAVPLGSPQICLTWDYASVSPGSPFEVAWFVDGVVEPAAGVVGTIDAASTDSFVACVSNPNGLADGQYEVAWFIDDEAVFSHAIDIGPEHNAAQLDIVNQTTSDVCVAQFSPAGSITYGLNLLSAPLVAGGTVSIPIVTGLQDIRVIDCDGLVLIEETSSTAIDGDSTYTLSSG